MDTDVEDEGGEESGPLSPTDSELESAPHSDEAGLAQFDWEDMAAAVAAERAASPVDSPPPATGRFLDRPPGRRLP